MKRTLAVFVLPLATAILAGLSLPAQAQCVALPYTLTNGQPTDAEEVMANLESLLDCGIETAGSPTAGALVTFADPTTIESGDLTGDVTTSGSTTTTLSPTSVVPGSYTSANITVDAKGRITAAANGSGSNGVPEAPWTTPTVASFDVTRLGTATFTDFTQAGVSGVLIKGPATTTNTNSLIYGSEVISVGASGWRVTTRIRRMMPLVQWGFTGIILRDSVSGKSVVYSLGYDTSPGIWRYQFLTDTSFPNTASGIVPFYDLDFWLRVTDDLTNRKVYISQDGFEWQEIYSEARTTYIVPTQAGVIFNPNFGTSNAMNGKNPVSMKVYSLLVESLP